MPRPRHPVPSTLSEASRDPRDGRTWFNHAKDHYADLVSKKVVSDRIQTMHGMKIIKTKWEFEYMPGTNNDDDDTSFRRARLVADGTSDQTNNDTADEASKPPADGNMNVRLDTVRLLLSIAAGYNYAITRFTVRNPFWHVDPEEEVYITHPEGLSYKPGEQFAVRKLLKCIPGLPQSHRLWFKTFSEKLYSWGFTRCSLDHGLFFRQGVILAVFVDDILLIAPTVRELNGVKGAIGNTFNVLSKKEMNGRFGLNHPDDYPPFLGLQIRRLFTESRVFLVNQRDFIQELLEKYEMTNVAPGDEPMHPDAIVSKEMSPKTIEEYVKMKNVPYRSLIGSLQYLVRGSRPDIAYAVGELAKYVNNPGMKHWEAAKRVLAFLKRTINVSIRLTMDPKSDKRNFEARYTCVDDEFPKNVKQVRTGLHASFFDSPLYWKSEMRDAAEEEPVFRGAFVAACEVGSRFQDLWDEIVEGSQMVGPKIIGEVLSSNNYVLVRSGERGIALGWDGVYGEIRKQYFRGRCCVDDDNTPGMSSARFLRKPLVRKELAQCMNQCGMCVMK